MDIDQAKTFLAIAAHGSFLEAAKRLHVTQSTVSARIQNLESELGTRLFTRNRAGASLTPPGQRFLQHAKTLVLTVEQARYDVGLPNRFRASIRIGGRIALWDDFLPHWVGWMRERAPDVSISSEIGFEDDLMRRLIEGTLDIGVMYTPSHAPGLIVEHLFNETLVMVSTRPDTRWPGEDYVYVEWGPGFYAKHRENYPDLERPPQVVNIGWLGVQLILANGGSCFLPIRMARALIQAGRLFQVTEAPEFPHPAYMVFPRKADSEVLQQAVEGLRELGREEKARA
ncbi:MAG: LysR family transcriptional regulator [Gammaproteobacteria bacterium]|nr:LysR family transcriptional regulator [Gammaproteobacteria bacterium]MCP5434134.1 LysR family transcriptional regulator [Chromatiaceae bacterium]MCW5585806.1 LysR family transcriptional regulator [Chromatiales bacterium]HOP15158.1 LysR family transcriptional regulator [Gammaproteobacteria bacterium]